MTVRPKGDAFVSADCARHWEVIGDPIEDWFVGVNADCSQHWEVIGDPIEDWFVGVDADGNKLPGGWEWYREEGLAVMAHS